ncbi:DUF1573 domain-containing protein [Aureibaculum sp. 2210JD6-5]|uniref:DUF1573 domain-containing protein n=1 Tax=Aureibaculum sp. 2210JD6-5 TaxID=3103957 RepID=UPI002AAE4DF6|nr:DUF1573 domain-containing protein [Aureibaculum sp. 2210JD6-5]MDY7395530.1 DUF1573 domain-containing protein [Aureibaculum sp. 2210JD6-5]
MRLQVKLITVLAVFSLISCKENTTSKIKQENLEIAKQRDYKMTEGASEITFSKTEYDFGTINEGDVVETTFDFKNTGKSALIISNATSTCGCTVPDYPKEPIPVGGTGSIKVKFDSSGKPNQQNKVVTLTTNTSKGKETVVIKANVTPKQTAS